MWLVRFVRRPYNPPPGFSPELVSLLLFTVTDGRMSLTRKEHGPNRTSPRRAAARAGSRSACARPRRVLLTTIAFAALNLIALHCAEPVARAQPPMSTVAPPIFDNASASLRRFRIVPRSSLPFQVDWRETADGESAAVLTGGVNVLIEGVEAPQLGRLGLPTEIGTIDIMTDRAVIWTRGVRQTGASEGVQSSDMPFEVYLEGNIVFRQGDRTVYAERMFYDARNKVGVLLDAELLAPVPEINGKNYGGLIRLKAAAIQQLSESQFVARDALITTSRLESPGYDISSDTIFFEDRQLPAIDPVTGAPLVDRSGAPVIDHQMLATARGNRVHVEGVPVFFWPTIATDLERPTYYINDFSVRRDQVFGTQVLLGFDAYQLFGVENAPRGTDWDLRLDYLSDRGLGWGTLFEYDDVAIGQIPGAATGALDIWAIEDSGFDNLGRGRRMIVPEADFRGRGFWEHRHHFGGGWQLTGEIGWLSDRTFLEEYYEADWDERRDATTAAELKHTEDNRSASILASGQINEFFTQTQWLPKFDHYWLGESILGDRLTWFEHTSLAYANIGIADPPTDPTLLAQWKLLPWEQDSAGAPISGKGERFVTRQEIDAPFELGVVKVVPFALGELGHWGEDLDGDPIDRAYVNAGVRASVPYWAAFPDVCDPIFNLNGLVHKVVFDAEATYADANEDFTDFPLYDPLDDINIIEFRRRLFFTTFDGTLPGAVPPKFDARYYALRSGLQSWVASPSMEIADDLETVRVGMRHRWQTKRGVPGRRHIVDWLTLDMNATWFPEADRDNFGADIGLLDYDMRWHLGDRFTVLSDGAADIFSDGLRTISAGVFINRPERGNAYLGFRTIDGPFSADVLTASLAYRMAPKWAATAGTQVDFAQSGNIGQSIALTRIGESLNVTVGTSYDASKDNLALSFLIEPRFLPTSRITRRSGLAIPPASAYEIE